MKVLQQGASEVCLQLCAPCPVSVLWFSLCFYFLWINFKGILSRVREQLQWHPSDRSEEFRITEAYFYSLLIPFSCFNSKKACCSSFSFDSYSANDQLRPEITQRMMSNSRRSAPVIIGHLPIDKAGGKYCYNRRMLKKVAQIIQQVTSRTSLLSEE